MTDRPFPLVLWVVVFGFVTFGASLGMQFAGVPGWVRTGWSMVAGFMFGRALARELIRRARERRP